MPPKIQSHDNGKTKFIVSENFDQQYSVNTKTDPNAPQAVPANMNHKDKGKPINWVASFGFKTKPGIKVDTKDIESVEILKDAAATAIYGSRAANGVVLITTKNPSKEKTSRRLKVDSKNLDNQGFIKSKFSEKYTVQIEKHGETVWCWDGKSLTNESYSTISSGGKTFMEIKLDKGDPMLGLT